jgi:hypothetical protein
MTAEQAPLLPPVPKDYSAAYVEELVNQSEHAFYLIQLQLDQARLVLAKLRTQIAPH